MKNLSFSTSTPRTSLGGPTNAKLLKIDLSFLDPMGIWKAIASVQSTKFEKFDELKHNARVWNGQFETAIVAVGGSIDAHALGVFPIALT